MNAKYWKTVKIEDLGKIVTGHTPPKKKPEYFNHDYRWIKPTDMDIGSRYVYETEEGYSKLAYEKYKKALLPPLSTCVVTIGTVGEKLCLTREPCFTNQSINAIIPNKDEYDGMFLYYLMKYNLQKVAKRNPGTASGRHHVSKSNFSSIKVTVPPKPIQEKIATILSSYDDLIENNNQRIHILEQIVKTIYDEWFVKYRYPGHEKDKIVEHPDLGMIPEGWEVNHLSDVATCNEKSIRKGNAPERIHYIEIKYVALGNIEKIHELPFANAPGRARRVVRKGDIIWSSVRPNLKAYALILKDDPLLIASTGFTVITPKKMPYTYLYQVLTTNNFVSYLVNHTKGAAYPAVSVEDFEKAALLCPDNEVLNEFDNDVKPMFKEIQVLKEKNEQLKSCRDLLLPRLISGELDVSNLDIEISEVSV